MKVTQKIQRGNRQIVNLNLNLEVGEFGEVWEVGEEVELGEQL